MLASVFLSPVSYNMTLQVELVNDFGQKLKKKCLWILYKSGERKKSHQISHLFQLQNVTLLDVWHAHMGSGVV